MKKILTIISVLFLFAGCRSVVIEDDFKKLRTTGITEITYETLVDYIDQNGDFILYIGRSDCRDCVEFHPILENFLKENPTLGVYYLDVKEFRDQANKEDATQEEKEFFKQIYDYLEFDWTPTLQHRRGKTVLTTITYLNMDYYEIEDELKQKEEKEKNIEEIFEWLKKEHD